VTHRTDPEPRRGPSSALLTRLAESGRRRSRAARTRGLGWRLVTPFAFVGAGTLLVTSSISSGGTDIRSERYTNLAELARQETARVQELRADVEELNREIEVLTGQLDNAGLAEWQQEIDALSMPAGLTAVEGPGLTVTLEDAPRAVRESAGDQVSNAIVHQQDIQAVVNALWAGGAEAMTLQGQRVVSTTGIKCVGNTVLLHGVTYSPPYVVSAIGDVVAMQDQIDTDPYIDAYQQAVDQWQLGWDLEVEPLLTAPAFEGPTEMRSARTVENPTEDDGT
jgi:uncharacterized protein YlxW (UPF0749 family)